MEFSQLKVEIKNRAAWLTLSRPEKRNALTPTLIGELSAALDGAEHDAAVRVVVLQAEGKAFCAGLDLDELGKISAMSSMENLADSETLAALYRRIIRHKKIIVSKVQGLAVAGGCGLATAADIVIADRDHAKFCYSETRIGFIPAIVSVLILRRTRNAGVREMLLRAQTVSADEALRLGMINYSVPTDVLEKTVDSLVDELASGTSPASIELTKRLLWSAETMTLEDAMNFAVSLNALSRTTADLEKGISTFLSKEKLSW